MWYKIKQGKHRASPLSLGIHTGKTSESYEVIFDDSCRYNLEGEDQWDFNKLVGWSYGFHHKNSIRIGWRYNPELDKIELCGYVYANGIRTTTENNLILELGKSYEIELAVYDYQLCITVYTKLGDRVGRIEQWDTIVNFYRLKKWGYNLGLFFGGNSPQPNKETMKVWIKKLKKH